MKRFVLIKSIPQNFPRKALICRTLIEVLTNYILNKFIRQSSISWNRKQYQSKSQVLAVSDPQLWMHGVMIIEGLAVTLFFVQHEAATQCHRAVKMSEDYNCQSTSKLHQTLLSFKFTYLFKEESKHKHKVQMANSS